MQYIYIYIIINVLCIEYNNFHNFIYIYYYLSFYLNIVLYSIYIYIVFFKMENLYTTYKLYYNYYF